MLEIPSRLIRDDVEAAVLANAGLSRVIDVVTIAETIRLRHETENVALEDIVGLVSRMAVRCGCAIEFGPRGAFEPGNTYESGAAPIVEPHLLA